jgi:hypothetical protein
MRKSPIDANPKYPWQHIVFDALIECHPEHIDKKLTAAEKAISERLVQRNLGRDEALALLDSLSALKVVHPKARLKVECPW